MDEFPVEILQNIFHLSLSHEYGEGKFSPYFTGPLFISHVCRHWRQVAISFGTLWTCLEISYDHPKIEYDMVQTWIERTNGLPLNFAIDYQLDDDDDIEGRCMLESVTKLLLAEQHRWRYVHFAWSFKAFSPQFTRIELMDLPLLLSLWLSIDIRKCGDDERILPNVSLARSRLVEHVTFDVECAVEYGTEPLQHLTDGQQNFRDSDWSGARAAEFCLEELRACPNLKRFYTDFVGGSFLRGDDQDTMSENRPHLVHDIEHLVLDDSGGNFPELVIGKVTLPNLRILDFKTSSFLETESALPGFFQRSNPPLERLDVYGSCAQHQNLVQALRHLPSLQTLVIENCQNPELLFEGLSSTVDGDIICPKLLYLNLRDYGRPEDVPNPRNALDALCTMVELREDPESPGRIRVNNNFVIPTSHIREEFEVILDLLSMEADDFNDLYITFEGLDEL